MITLQRQSVFCLALSTQPLPSSYAHFVDLCAAQASRREQLDVGLKPLSAPPIAIRQQQHHQQQQQQQGHQHHHQHQQQQQGQVPTHPSNSTSPSRSASLKHGRPSHDHHQDTGHELTNSESAPLSMRHSPTQQRQHPLSHSHSVGPLEGAKARAPGSLLLAEPPPPQSQRPVTSDATVLRMVSGLPSDPSMASRPHSSGKQLAWP